MSNVIGKFGFGSPAIPLPKTLVLELVTLEKGKQPPKAKSSVTLASFSRQDPDRWARMERDKMSLMQVEYGD
ncbi:hypothetical protein VM1G_11221 [Cytospora mali]|uniref:Uncharacterized protein n=1 Tax=Cytospora mali TaxID=578113 RepID=A0A194VKA2_CYTMA|nr:hypothetical protein VM1G_11221 [Valsa mali]